MLSIRPEADLSESWRCTGCKRLIFNLDPRGYPREGAPIPLYLNEDHPTVCSLCYEMHRALDRADCEYWRKLPRNLFTVVRPDPYTNSPKKP